MTTASRSPLIEPGLDTAAPPEPVQLRVWGFTESDARMGLAAAMRSLGLTTKWTVVEDATVVEIGPPCTIRLHDPAALSEGFDYEWRWMIVGADPKSAAR